MFLCTAYFSWVCLRVDCHNSHRHFKFSSLGQIMLPLTDPPTWQVLPTMSPNQLCCPQILNRRARPPAKQHSHVFPASRHPVSHLKRGRRGTREAFNLQICWQLLFFYFFSTLEITFFFAEIWKSKMLLLFFFTDFSELKNLRRYFLFSTSEISFDNHFFQGITLVGKLNPRFFDWIPI